MELINDLKWRYATKRYTTEKVPAEQLETILEAIRLSASSIGLQPYSVLVIKDEELRKKIQPIAYNQPQITEASHLLIFAAWDNVTSERVEEYLNDTINTRKVSRESLQTIEGYLYNLVNNNTAEQNFNWAARQAYIALGTALIAAADLRIDATPMEGFNPEALDELLGLEARELKSVALLPVGYRDAGNDWLSDLPKVRRSKEKFVIQLAAADLQEAV
jgi:nitroreductase